MAERWLLIDKRPARVLRVDSDMDGDYLHYETPEGVERWIRVTGISNAHRIAALSERDRREIDKFGMVVSR